MANTNAVIDDDGIANTEGGLSLKGVALDVKFVNRMINDHFLKMPALVRVVVYLVFVALFVATYFVVLVNVYDGVPQQTQLYLVGKSSDGKITKQKADGLQIKYKNRLAGTDENGQAVLLLNFSDYVKAKISDHVIDVGVSKFRSDAADQVISMRWKSWSGIYEGEVEEVLLTSLYQVRDVPEIPVTWNLVSTAYADEYDEPQEVARLYLRTIEIKDESIEHGNIELSHNRNNTSSGLKDRRTGHTIDSMLLPLGTLDLRERSFFSVSGQVGVGQIRFGYGKTLFSGGNTKVLQPEGDCISFGDCKFVSENQGVVVDAVLRRPSEIIIWKKNGQSDDFIGKVTEKFSDNGFISSVKDAPLKVLSAQNAVFIGKAVSLADAQSSLRVIKESAFEISSVQCGLNLKSKVFNQIQVGTSKKYLGKSLLNESDWSAFLQAKNLDDFSKHCDPA